MILSDFKIGGKPRAASVDADCPVSMCMEHDKTFDKTFKIVMTGILACLIIVMTMMVRIPVPFTQGYVHLGDTVIFIAVLMVGRNYGTAAAGIGSALADLFAGYAYFAPWTLLVKGLMGFTMGTALEILEKRGKLVRFDRVPKLEILSMFLAGVEMVAGYYFAEVIMYSSWLVPLPTIPANAVQALVGMVLAALIAAALYRTPIKKYFAIK